MHKLISVILSLVFILPLAACGGAKAPLADGVNQNPGEKAGSLAVEGKVSLTGEIGGEITVSAYETMKYKAFLEDAARQFEEKYPGTRVKVDTFSTMPDIKISEQEGENMVLVEYRDDPQGRQDYINGVDTALMSGGGADILAMDVLPFYKYAAAGQLENLAAYMQADPEFNKADYRANILDAVEYKNGTWFLPMDYTFTYYAYDSALLADGAASGLGTNGKFTAEALIALAQASYDGSAKLFNKPDYVKGPGGCLWENLLEEHYTSFVDIENKKANFNDRSFGALLEAVKRYSGQGYISKGAAGRRDAESMMERAGEGAADSFFFQSQNVINLISLFTRDLDIKMTAMAEGNTMAVGENDEIGGIAANADGSVPFACSQAYGITANSKNKETAWAFLRFLLSEEMQLSPNLPLTALPVSNAARGKKMEIALASMMGQQGLKEAQLEAIEKYNEAVEGFSDRIDAYVIRDAIVDDMIASEVEYFFAGTKTAAMVAEVLQNKVGLYLNE